MDGNLFISHATDIVDEYLKENYEYASREYITTVWACKTAENNKVILTSLDPDIDLIFEVTFRGTVNHAYLDVYSKIHHDDLFYSEQDDGFYGGTTNESK